MLTVLSYLAVAAASIWAWERRARATRLIRRVRAWWHGSGQHTPARGTRVPSPDQLKEAA